MTTQTTRQGSVANVQVDNDRVRVTEYRFEPGGQTGWHQHEYDYVVVPQTDGLLLLTGPGGVKSEARLTRGVPYYRQAGVEHNVTNGGDGELVFIEIEMKAHPIEAA